MIKVGYVQRLLPYYRLGFYKALARQSKQIHYTIFRPKGKDFETQIETISPKQFEAATDSVWFDWVDTPIKYYSQSNILWQSGVLWPLICKRFDVFIISNKMTHLFYWLVIICCKIRGIKIVFWSHGMQGNEIGFKFWLKKKYLNIADLNLVYSHYNKRLMKASGIPSAKIKIASNSLDYEVQDKLYREIAEKDKDYYKQMFFKNENKVILFIGRLLSTKRPDLIIQAAALLKNRGISLNLIFIGDGPEKTNLEEKARKLGMENCMLFAGKIYNEADLVKYFHVAELMVSPGNVGLNCIHSLAYGVPVITHSDFSHQGPEVEAIIDRQTGLFFKKDDAEDLANKMEYWLNNNSKEASSKAARERISSSFTPAIQAQKVLEGLNAMDI